MDSNQSNVPQVSITPLINKIENANPKIPGHKLSGKLLIIIIIILTVTLLAILIGGLIVKNKTTISSKNISGSNPNLPPLSERHQEIANDNFEDKTITLIVTDDSQSKEKAKIAATIPTIDEINNAVVDKIDPEGGRYFVYFSPVVDPYWTKNVLVPIDLIWIRGNKIVEIKENLAPSTKNQSEDSIPLYKPDQAIDKAIEVNAGFVKKHQIAVGDLVTLE